LWKIEDIIIQKGLENFQAFGLHISEAIYDENNFVDGTLQKIGILSQNDLWHEAKTIGPKVSRKLSQGKNYTLFGSDKSKYYYRNTAYDK
jgi:hypothetical protein